jgi:hypothetical protein
MSQPASASGHMRAALTGAFALACGRREGMDAMPADPQAAILSFWAAALCLPAFITLRLLAWSILGTPGQPVRAMLAAILLFVIGWAGYAVLSHRVAAVLGRAAFWPRYIVAWNWCNVAQYALFLIAGLPGMLGAPDWMDQTLSLIALFWALWLEWYVARLALQIGALPAILLVALDVTIGLLLAV